VTTTPPARRETFHVELRPVVGSRFQPTGFPDIGAAVYDRPMGDGTWRQDLLVESAQSMANHLEATCWDRGRQDQVPELEGLPYARVVDPAGQYLTSSRTEAHRLASAFVKDSTLDGRIMTEVIRDRLQLQDDRPVSPLAIAAAVLAMDPLTLIHGVFFAEKASVWPGQPRIARVTTALVEAHDVRPVVSGGVKRDDVRHTVAEGGGSAEGYGSIPFHRTEYVASTIKAGFSIDHAQIAAYGLPEPATHLLATLARWEVRALLDSGMRLRTACDLEVVGEIPLPALADLTAELRGAVAASAEHLGPREPWDVIWGGSTRRKKA